MGNLPAMGVIAITHDGTVTDRRLPEEVESQDHLSGQPVSKSGATRLVRTASKAFHHRGSDKCGIEDSFTAYLEHEYDVKNYLVHYVGNRANIIFEGASALYFHIDHIVNFVGLLPDPNLLLKAVRADAMEKVFRAELKALGIFFPLKKDVLFDRLFDEESDREIDVMCIQAPGADLLSRSPHLRKPVPGISSRRPILKPSKQTHGQMDAPCVMGVARLARYESEEEELRKQRRVAWHAATEEDKQAIKDQIDRWDIEPGYPCQHRRPLEYLGCAGKEWQQYYNEYKEERLAGGKRVLSLVRWREYVRAFRPRLRLKRATTDNCNSCYKIEIELKDPTISQERKAELKLQKEMHLEKAIVQRRAMNKAIADYQIAWAPEECIVKEALSLVADDSVESEDLAATDTNQPGSPATATPDHPSSPAIDHPSSSPPNTSDQPSSQSATITITDKDQPGSSTSTNDQGYDLPSSSSAVVDKPSSSSTPSDQPSSFTTSELYYLLLQFSLIITNLFYMC
eukprot:XP_011661178.1 PREDICTED: uncharacterized protein LOC105436859 [Strongylocentrotus purpuratus]